MSSNQAQFDPLMTGDKENCNANIEYLKRKWVIWINGKPPRIHGQVLTNSHCDA